MAFYVLLLALAGVIASVALHEALVSRLEDRVREQVTQELSELQRLLELGRDPRTGRSFGSDLGAVFDLYLERNVPSDGEGFAAFVEGRPHRSVLSRYPLRQLPPDMLREWRALSRLRTAGREPLSGAYGTLLGQAHYAVLPTRAGQTYGAFVVTVLPAEELGEFEDLMRGGFAITLVVVLLASVLGWFLGS